MTTETAPSIQQILDTFAKEKLIGIVRTDTVESCLWATSQLIEAGFNVIEIPFTVPETPRVIETLCERYPQALFGAGTVLEAKEALEALGAGARFLVSPVLVEPLIQFAAENDICALPGSMTPSEIYKAWTLGASAVKFFPAESAGGADFVKSLKGPLPQIPIVPTGGIQKEHIKGYLDAGVLAVGIGAPLIPSKLIQSKDASGLQAHAKTFLAKLSL